MVELLQEYMRRRGDTQLDTELAQLTQRLCAVQPICPGPSPQEQGQAGGLDDVAGLLQVGALPQCIAFSCINPYSPSMPCYHATNTCQHLTALTIDRLAHSDAMAASQPTQPM